MTLVIYTKNNVISTSEEKVETETGNCLFTVSSDQNNCTIKINNIETNSLVVKYGSVVQYEVSKEDYVTEKGELKVCKNIELQAKMRKTKVKFMVTPNPSDATVIINGTEQSYVEVDPGTVVTWSVSKTDYSTKTGTTTVNSDTTLPVVLTWCLEYTTAGTYTKELPAGKYQLDIVGGGAGGAMCTDTSNDRITGGSGGSGAYYNTVVELSAGIYTINVGAGSNKVTKANTYSQLKSAEVSAAGSSSFSGEGIQISVPGAGAWTCYKTSGSFGFGASASQISTSGFTPISEIKTNGNNGKQAPTELRPSVAGSNTGGASAYKDEYGAGGGNHWTYNISSSPNYYGYADNGKAGCVIIQQIVE